MEQCRYFLWPSSFVKPCSWLDIKSTIYLVFCVFYLMPFTFKVLLRVEKRPLFWKACESVTDIFTVHQVAPLLHTVGLKRQASVMLNLYNIKMGLYCKYSRFSFEPAVTFIITGLVQFLHCHYTTVLFILLWQSSKRYILISGHFYGRLILLAWPLVGHKVLKYLPHMSNNKKNK